jgi:hypothetical protein
VGVVVIGPPLPVVDNNEAEEFVVDNNEVFDNVECKFCTPKGRRQKEMNKINFFTSNLW